MRLKILVSVVLTLMVGYTAFWHYMAGELESRIESWITDQKSNGLSVRYDNLEISGFPYRMQIALDALSVAKTGEASPALLITSPKVTLVAFPWKINHGVLFSDGGKVRIGSRAQPTLQVEVGKTRSSVIVDLSERQLRQASFVMDRIAWHEGTLGAAGYASSARDIKLHLLRPAASPDETDMERPVQMKLYLEASDVVADKIPVEIFGKKADMVKVDLQIHGGAFPQFNREGLTRWREGGGTLAVNNLEVTYGEMDMQLSGESALDQELKPLGAFSSRIHGIDKIVGILAQHSAFQQEPGNLILGELRRMSSVEESGKHQGRSGIDLAVSLQGGLLFVGPIPVYEFSPIVP